MLFKLSKFEFVKTEEQKDSQGDLMSLLDKKKLVVGEISVHLMKDKVLHNFEYLKPNEFNPRVQNLEFPYEYPTVNHPSTIVLIKGPS
jgi:hypothetical protein